MEEADNLLDDWNLSNKPSSKTAQDKLPSATLKDFSSVLRGESNSVFNTHSVGFCVGILCLVKLCSSFSIFLLANLMNAKLSHTIPWVANLGYSPNSQTPTLYPFLQIITFIQFGSGIIFFILLNVFRVNTLPRPVLSRGSCTRDSYWFRVFIHSLLSITLLSVRLGGIQLCGPFKAVFLGTFYDTVIASIFLVLTCQSKYKWHWQGVGLFFAGLIMEFFCDDYHLDHVNEPFNDYSNAIGLSMLVFAGFLKYEFNGMGWTQSLVVSSGGPIQLHSISSLVSGIFLLSLTVIHLLFSEDMIFFHLLPVSFIVIFGFVLDYYVDVIISKRLDTNLVARLGTTSSFFSAFFFVLVLSRIGTASPPGLMSLLAFGLLYTATVFLTMSPAGNGPIDRQIFTNSETLPRFLDRSALSIPQMDLNNQKMKTSHSVVMVA